MNDAMRLANIQSRNIINAENVIQLKIANYLKLAELSENKYDKSSYMRKAKELMRE